MTFQQLPADLGSKASHYTEDALAVAACLGLAVAVYSGITTVKQRNRELAEAEALLREEQEIASRSAVRRVRKLVQRIRGNA